MTLSLISRPWRWAIGIGIAAAIASPMAYKASVFAYLLTTSSDRVASCLQTADRATCTAQNSWDSVSFANLDRAIDRGFVPAGVIHGILAGCIAFRMSSQRSQKQLPDQIQRRLQSAANDGLDIEQMLNEAGYK